MVNGLIVQFLAPPTFHENPIRKDLNNTHQMLRESSRVQKHLDGWVYVTPASGISWEIVPSKNKWVIRLDGYVPGRNDSATHRNTATFSHPNQWNSILASSSTWRHMLVRWTKGSKPQVRKIEYQQYVLHHLFIYPLDLSCYRNLQPWYSF